jgi:hypothetical protein
MKNVTLLAGTAVLVGLSLGLVRIADAQAGRAAGVVTSVQGTANLQRVSTTDPGPQILPLKFRDEVRIADRITTGDQSLARILLGGKAVVTVREHSSLTITEQTGSSTIDITAGKIALAVAKERLGPNERIEIKTPNAVAGVRGTVVITEVGQFTAQAGGTTAGGVNTRFTLLTGALEVNLLDPSGRRTTQFTMGPLQQLSLTGFTPPPGGPRNITPAEGEAAANDYKVGLKDAPSGSNGGVTDRQVEEATNTAARAGGGAGPASGTGIIDQTNNIRNITDPMSALPPNCTNNCAPPPTVTVPDTRAKEFPCSPSICEIIGGQLAGRLRSATTRPR